MTTAADAIPGETRGAHLRYLPGIDGLRAVSVLAVLAYHHYVAELWGTTLGRHPNVFPGGFMGVEVFFVISGYLITSLLLAERRRTGTVSLPYFWLRRARRLLPALFFMLAVVTFIALVAYDDTIEVLKGDVLAALTYTSNWWQIFANRSYISVTGRPPLLAHLWSLAIEEQYYLIWPPVLLLGLHKLGRSRMLLAMLAVALLSTVWLAVSRGTGDDPSGAYFSTFGRLSGLLLGSAFAFIWAPYRIRGRTGRNARWVLDLIGIVGLYGLWWSFRNMHIEELSTFRGGFLLVDIATILVIAAAAHPAADLGLILGVRPLQWLGQRSYGIYLWHYPIFALTRPHGLDNTWWPWFTILVRGGLTIGMAAFSYRYIESPIRAGAIARWMAGLREARGAPRRELATRGAFVGLVVTAVALTLGGTLAAADPGGPKIHGLENIDESAAGDQADPDVLAAFTTTTAAPGATVTTAVAPDTTPATGADPGAAATTPPETAAPPTTPPLALTTGVLGIGDSVMLGAKSELQSTVPGMYVDAVVSRQFAEAIQVIRDYDGLGALPPTLVIHLGTNGRWNGPEFDTMMEAIGPNRRVFFVTARMPRSWEEEVNRKLAEGVARHPDKPIQLIDWRQYAGCHDDWFAHDGFHVTDVGAQNYANFVNAHVSGQAASLQYCP